MGLHSKMYSLLFDNGSTQTRTVSKVVKGVKSCVIRTSLTFHDCICCMLEDEVMEHSFLTVIIDFPMMVAIRVEIELVLTHTHTHTHTQKRWL